MEQNTSRKTRGLWPKWMWIAVPVLVVVVVSGLWWPGPCPPPPPRVQSRTPAGQPSTIAPLLRSRQVITTTRQIIGLLTPSIGATVVVVGTGGSGLNMRSAPGTASGRVKTLREGSRLVIIGGPKDVDSFTWWQVRQDVDNRPWWQVRDGAGGTGWVASKFVAPE